MSWSQEADFSRSFVLSDYRFKVLSEFIPFISGYTKVIELPQFIDFLGAF